MYQVTLSHCKNPTVAGGYWGRIPTDTKSRVSVATLREAAEVCVAYIERNALGGGNWNGGKVYLGKKQIARISYNGRVWAMDGSEIE